MVAVVMFFAFSCLFTLSPANMAEAKAQVSMYEAQLSSFLPAIRDGRLDFAIGTLSACLLYTSRCV